MPSHRPPEPLDEQRPFPHEPTHRELMEKLEEILNLLRHPDERR